MKKLNLGCDYDYREGWVNLDFHRNLKCDVVHDLNKFPWPFKKNEFDFILANHVLEHLNDLPMVMKEIHRISKPGAIIRISVPYFNSYGAFCDPTHKRFFTWDTFSFFCKLDDRTGKVGYIDKMFRYKSRKLIWASSTKPIFKQICSIMDWLVNLNPSFFEKRIPWLVSVEAFVLELEVVK